MKIGIVGSGEDKFDAVTRAKAIELITSLLSREGAVLVSGHSPMGGIDIWAENVAEYLGVPKRIYAPKVNAWGAPGGFRDRNLLIARDSDEVHVITVRDYPLGYNGRRFEYCYHCIKVRPEHAKDHVKGGGCWTGLKGMEMSKPVIWHVIS